MRTATAITIRMNAMDTSLKDNATLVDLPHIQPIPVLTWVDSITMVIVIMKPLSAEMRTTETVHAFLIIRRIKLPQLA